jgi:hypothetical protein
MVLRTNKLTFLTKFQKLQSVLKMMHHNNYEGMAHQYRAEKGLIARKSGASRATD